MYIYIYSKLNQQRIFVDNEERPVKHHRVAALIVQHNTHVDNDEFALSIKPPKASRKVHAI